MTSGEIKIHVEEHCPQSDPTDRAVEIFRYLALDKTALKNGVLIYLAYGDNKIAIIGDKGINEKAGQDFWDSTRDILLSHFKKEQFEKGFVEAIAEVGLKLKTYFPAGHDDRNEISDDISFG